MNEIIVKDVYSDVFRYLGDMQTAVDNALRNYAVGKINEKIAELGMKVGIWEKRYGCTYDVFSYRTATDEEYVRELNQNPSTAMWEGDMIMWEYQSGELAKWYRCLQNILKES
ncbi:MAG: hypothetical protein R2941_23980 [Desulfobacterales bacterium]